MTWADSAATVTTMVDFCRDDRRNPKPSRPWPLIALALGAALAGAEAAAQTHASSAGRIAIETVASGLAHPWGLAFLPDGRMLVTERPGRLRLVTRDGRLSEPLPGVPKVFASGQGGLLDVMLDRAFAQNRTLYLCFAEPAGGRARTALLRAAFADGPTPRLDNVTVIFRQDPATSRGLHFGCRIAQTADGLLFLTTGDHGSERNRAQTLDNHIGKVIRIAADGSVPTDNPFVGRADAKPEIWSYGHRNAQGLAIHPASGVPWLHEHGPRGGDEINIPRKGLNYGWPVIGHGIDYSGARIHEAAKKAGMEQPIHHWTPSIAPSGMAFYEGDLFPAWKNSLLVGALAGQMLVRLELDGEGVVREERLLGDLGARIRDVRVGPDGAVYLLSDSGDGRILRLAPAR